MAVTVTMLQTRRGEGGSLWTAGNSYSASDAFAQFLISSNLATGTLPPLLQPGAADVPGLVKSKASAAGVNAAAIQAALNGRGLVQILEPGNFFIPGDSLAIPSYTSMLLGPETRLIQAPGTQGNLLVNSRWKSPRVTCTNGITDSATSPALLGRRLVTGDCGANAHGLTAGDGVLVRGDTSRRYNGVHRVVAVLDPFRFTFYASKKTAIGSSTGTVTVEAANLNISLRGGAWDYDAYNNQSVGGMATMAMVFSKVRDLHIQQTSIVDPLKYCAYIINSHDTTVRDLHCNGASDGVHLHAFTINAMVDRVTGESGDDFIAYTSNNADYSQYDFLNTDGSDSMSAGGDLLGLNISNIKPTRCGEDVVAVYPQGANAVEGVLIEDIGSDNDTANCQIVIGTGTAGPAGTAVKDITIRGVRGIGRANTILIGRSTDANGITVEKLDISGIFPNATYSGTGGIIAMNKATIRKMIVTPASKMTMEVSAARYFIQGTGVTIDDLHVDKYESETTGSGNFHSVLAFDATSTLKNVHISAPRLSGSSQLVTGAPAGNPIVTVTDWWVASSRLLWANFACRMQIKGGRAAGSGGVALLAAYGNVTVDVVANGNDWGTSTFWLKVGASAGETTTCNLYHGAHASAPGTGTGIEWTATSPTVRLRASDGSLPVDAAKFTSISSGAIFYNNNAAYGAGVGLYGFGATTATRIAA